MNKFIIFKLFWHYSVGISSVDKMVVGIMVVGIMGVGILGVGILGVGILTQTPCH